MMQRAASRCGQWQVDAFCHSYPLDTEAGGQVLCPHGFCPFLEVFQPGLLFTGVEMHLFIVVAVVQPLSRI